MSLAELIQYSYDIFLKNRENRNTPKNHAISNLNSVFTVSTRAFNYR